MRFQARQARGLSTIPLAAASGRPPTTPVETLCLVASGVLGLTAYLFPLIVRPTGGDESAAHVGDAPLLFIALMAPLAVMLASRTRADAGGGRGTVGGAKLVALLGVLVAINATLRLLPTFAGASPVFLLIILVGYAYGPALGYLMGALTLFVSAIMTGGIGPWLPYQMLGAGWMGMTCGWLPDLRRRPRAERAMLAACGVGWGLLYGAILNLWFWPFALSPGVTMGGEMLAQYAVFYALTSLAYDSARAVALAALLLALATPLLRVLRRFQRRFTWQPLTLDGVPAEASGLAQEIRRV